MQYNYIARSEGSNLQVLTQVSQRGGGSLSWTTDLEFTIEKSHHGANI